MWQCLTGRGDSGSFQLILLVSGNELRESETGEGDAANCRTNTMDQTNLGR
jgi:hypothetical protein